MPATIAIHPERNCKPWNLRRKVLDRRDTVKRRGRYDFKSDFTVEYRRTERDFKI